MTPLKGSLIFSSWSNVPLAYSPKFFLTWRYLTVGVRSAEFLVLEEYKHFLGSLSAVQR